MHKFELVLRKEFLKSIKKLESFIVTGIKENKLRKNPIISNLISEFVVVDSVVRVATDDWQLIIFRAYKKIITSMITINDGTSNYSVIAKSIGSGQRC